MKNDTLKKIANSCVNEKAVLIKKEISIFKSRL